MKKVERANSILHLNQSVLNYLLSSIDGLVLFVNLLNREAKKDNQLYYCKDTLLGFIAKHHHDRWIKFDNQGQEVLYVRVRIGSEDWVIGFHSGRWHKKYPELIKPEYIWRENNSQQLAHELIAVFIGY
jgi:hypothetical protein